MQNKWLIPAYIGRSAEASETQLSPFGFEWSHTGPYYEGLDVSYIMLYYIYLYFIYSNYLLIYLLLLLLLLLLLYLLLITDVE